MMEVSTRVVLQHVRLERRRRGGFLRKDIRWSYGISHNSTHPGGEGGKSDFWGTVRGSVIEEALLFRTRRRRFCTAGVKYTQVWIRACLSKNNFLLAKCVCPTRHTVHLPGETVNNTYLTLIRYIRIITKRYS